MNDLRGDVLWCAAKCPRARPRLHANLVMINIRILEIASQVNQDLAEPEVCDLDVALLVEHHIVQLEVPVEHAMLVQVEQGGADLSCIEPAVTISASTEDLIPDHYVATGSLNLPDCWMWNMRSPPGTNSRTK